MKVENLMIKAVKKFMKKFPNAEIRNCYLDGGYGTFGSWTNCTFHIEYVEGHGGEYKDVYIDVAYNE